MKPPGVLSQHCWDLEAGVLPKAMENGKGRGQQSLYSPALCRPGAHLERLALAPSLCRTCATQETTESLQLVCKGKGGFGLYNVWGDAWDSGSVREEAGSPLPPHPLHLKPRWGAHLPLPSFPPCGRHYAKGSPDPASKDDRWKEGPRQGLPGKSSLHFHLHLPPAATLDHRPVGQSPADRRAQAAGLCVLTACLLPAVPPSRGGGEDGGDSSSGPSLSAPFLSPDPQGAD